MKELSFQDSYEVYLLRTNYEVISVRLPAGKNSGGIHAMSGRNFESDEKSDGRRI